MNHDQGDPGPESEVGFSGLSIILAFGGGLCSLSTSSLGHDY